MTNENQANENLQMTNPQTIALPAQQVMPAMPPTPQQVMPAMPPTPQQATQPAQQAMPPTMPTIPQASQLGSEQMTPDGYQAIIAQQQAQIEALIAQTNAQSQQITQLVQTGGQFMHTGTPGQAQQQMTNMQQVTASQFPNYYEGDQLGRFNQPSLADQRDVSLEGLAKEIGKKGENADS